MSDFKKHMIDCGNAEHAVEGLDIDDMGVWTLLKQDILWLEG